MIWEKDEDVRDEGHTKATYPRLLLSSENFVSYFFPPRYGLAKRYTRSIAGWCNKTLAHESRWGERFIELFMSHHPPLCSAVTLLPPPRLTRWKDSEYATISLCSFASRPPCCTPAAIAWDFFFYAQSSLSLFAPKAVVKLRFPPLVFHSFYSDNSIYLTWLWTLGFNSCHLSKF